jgi:cytochrome P450
MPIASLPILNGKLYAIFDASIIQSAYRNKHLSFAPFVVEFAKRELNFDAEVDRIIKETDLMKHFFDAVHEGMATQHVHKMNAVALGNVARRWSQLGAETRIDNVWLWARDLMTVATCEALYGKTHNFMVQGSPLVDDIWHFENDLPLLMLGIFPSITAKKAYYARERLQAALSKYYGAHYDQLPEAAGITKCRAGILRKYGVDGNSVGVVELALLHVATANTVPTLFWFMAFVLTRPELVERLREEAGPVVQDAEDGTKRVNVDVLADECPLFVSCYRETIRLSNKAIGQRRVMADTTVSDGQGRSYLLKEGVNVQMASEPLHGRKEVWGEDADGFHPERFMDITKNLNSATTKAKRASYIPFGGGKHLCPGRNFAFAENLGFMISLIVGFDTSPLDGDWSKFKPPTPAQCPVTGAVSKPVANGKGFGMKLTRREGWENVTWSFVSGKLDAAYGGGETNVTGAGCVKLH